MAFEYRRLLEDDRAKAYLRSFASERSHWNELVEATFLYGVHCIAQNYALHTLTTDQVVDITRATLKKPLHYHATHAVHAHEAAPKRAMAAKPSSSWRRGSADEPSPNPVAPPPPTTPAPALPDGRQELEMYAALVGKPWMQAAWQSFVATTGYPSIDVDASEDAFYTAYDALRAAPTLTPHPAPRTFLDFVRAALLHGLRPPVGTDVAPPTIQAPNTVDTSSQLNPAKMDVSCDQRRPATTSTTRSQPSPAKATTRSQPSTPRARSLTSARTTTTTSKVKTELEAPKANVLRVRKNTTQRLHEALAKHKRNANDATTSVPPRATSRPIARPGSKALEIAEMLAASPFLQTVETTLPEPTTTEPTLQSELYGPDLVDTDGCRAPSANRQRAKDALKPKRHVDYKGWLGDYGPAHTRTLVPGDWSELDDADTRWLQQRRGTKAGDLPPFEWNLDAIDVEVPQESSGTSAVHTSDIDPAFEWLVPESRRV
ncbi:hypothetical protein SDRG_09377 [Saprolegnia diclina VS20]|uniref:Uncharacterized protein n=1 Tax=Saprolegnia diclina (strain VS20) TaxID=1156394 RepID=T0QGT0_SAPDV|nr:hypothetical protein SDRG_09377 [Saprolegnia diclina VS20]EQC32840.1 hypothetical protein SDRG_09377 [Saprolegnia diclina VS20]|eukprot:XP_008613526.1 hypothetical protein SDRG_09377 [Saprolegnia diclina VS20]